MDSETQHPQADTGKMAREYGEKILARIKASEKREENWLKAAESAETAYTADTGKDAGTGKLYDFNILHSNVETIVPAIYNSTPQPDIRPRRVESAGPAPKPPEVPEGQQPEPQMLAQFQQAQQVYQQKKQADQDARNFATMLERAISVQIDDNVLDTEVELLAQDGFMAGRGILRLRYEGVYQQDERITFEAVSWRDYREGPAKRWEDVPWVAYRVILARETHDRLVDENEDFITSQLKNGEDNPLLDGTQDDDIEHWEVWDKIEKKVCVVRASDGVVIQETSDPLELPGFFPQGKPVQPICVTGRRTPVCPFTIYSKLADELDLITKRINKIMKGVKVRGVIAGNAATLLALSEADDNEIRVEDNLEQLAQTGGLDKAVIWWPVEQAIKVLAELYKQRDQVKASIYEITGISDIVRGASNAGETATAQQIKTQWGSLRIQRMQRMIERQVRDIFVVMSHIITTKFAPETLSRMTGIDITPGIKALMDSRVDTTYRINVESDSTVRADLTEKKREMSEFLDGSAQFFNTAGQIVQQTPEAAEPLAEVYAATTRMFSLGKQAEDALERFVSLAKEQATRKRPDPEAEKLKAEMQMKQAEMAMKGEGQKADVAVKGEELKIKKAELEIKKAELAIKTEELDLKRAEVTAKAITDAEKVENDREAREREAEVRRNEKAEA